MTATDVFSRGRAATARAQAPAPMPPPAHGCGVKIPIQVTPDLRLLNTATGEILGRCSTPEIAQRTKEFFS